MAECQTSDSTSSPSYGIILVLMACICYSLGNCLQRYSLLRKEGELVFGILHRNLGWLLGAMVYFSANGLYAVALSFAPVSVLAAVFSLTIVVNSACSMFFLGDVVPRKAWAGYLLVMAGAVLFAVSVRAEVCHFDGGELIEVMTTVSAVLFWSIMTNMLLWGAYFAWKFEKAHPLTSNFEGQAEYGEGESTTHYVSGILNSFAQPNMEIEKVEPPNQPTDDINPKTLLVARVLYPLSLGATEAVGSLVLKAMNSLLTSMATEEDEDDAVWDNDYPEDIPLYITLVVAGLILFAGIVIWLRLVYSRFEITGAFPLEFGMLTFASVLGGFTVYQDYNYVTDAFSWILVCLASFSIFFGLVIVAIESWKATVERN